MPTSAIVTTSAPVGRPKRRQRKPAITDYELTNTATRKLGDYLASSGYRIEIFIRRDYSDSTIFTFWRTSNGGAADTYWSWPKETAERVIGKWLEKAR